MIDPLRSALCCSLFLLLVLSLGEVQLRGEAAAHLREKLRFAAKLAELYSDNLQEFSEVCRLAGVSAWLEENGRLAWQLGPRLKYSVRFPASFAHRPAELVVWTD